MQQTRRLILEIIKRRGQATVGDIVADLHQQRGAITAVTVRHHLKLLQQDDLITTPELSRRSAPGRPRHIYTLTEKAQTHFPNNYERLAAGLLAGLRHHLPPEGVNVILEGVASHIAADFDGGDGTFEERLDRAVDHLNASGYHARWQQADGGYLLLTENCPYHQLSVSDPGLCYMDMRLISDLLGVVPRRVERIAEGDEHCSYFIPVVNPS
jgi:predicted ArsR family transcriptional regulator